MQKLYKESLIAVGAAVALFVIALLALNFFVQPASAQEHIERALSSGLRVPVRVMSPIVTPWSGLKASGITVGGARAGGFSAGGRFHASFD